MSFTFKRTITLPKRRTIKVPEIMSDADTIPSGKEVDIVYGRNFQVVVVIPHGIKLGKLQQERIQRFTDEPLETDR